MEFGVFIQGYVPQFRREGDPEAEHKALMEELELVIAADKAGFKYVWLTEHHFLDEYSHLSANDAVAGYLANATERIHIGSGIFNPLPQVNHPAKVAERVAMLDHLSGGRFEFGTGRGAGSHEILGFLHKEGITDTSATKEIWEDVIGEFAKMWTQDTYEGYEGKFWSLPPRKVLPKPWGKGHPAMWYAAGNTTSYAMAARKGLGVLGFSVGELAELAPVLEAYKKEIVNAEPVGSFVNDNIMVTSGAFVAETTEEAVDAIMRSSMTYLQSNVFRYHDTFPRPEWVPPWPQTIPMPPIEEAQAMIGQPGAVMGNPDQALKGAQAWADAGADQLVFGLGSAERADDLKMIELMGEHVIPKIDTDPVHRTTRLREAAA
ncbi:MAG: LLM class flavin-dependent oxidoreductase [bacterium]|nr:LLM class flavin-dependent oxidoreductase [bacterium]MXZ84240.1 LLM class flavin-dependent oxidoreductase [Acidimicrobiia bacterium]MYB10499.1 LLM class flavin-dependent oxidoreductase [Acidimicrobiia bacterium]MYG59319.1 LLM class flavin-dependent oxidoreductase [Acidimicrobiia bacterium]MYG72720.1 LLM class flavin-dependent oxidoreductase [Acidimicrobiia bacterium]